MAASSPYTVSPDTVSADLSAAGPLAGTSAAESASAPPGHRIFNAPWDFITTTLALSFAARQNVTNIWVRHWDQLIFHHDDRAVFYRAVLLFPNLTHIYFIALTPPSATYAHESPPVATRTADWHVDYFYAYNRVAFEYLRDDLFDAAGVFRGEPVEKYRFAANWLPWEERPYEDWHTVAGPEEWVDLRQMVLKRSAALEVELLRYMRRVQGASEELGELTRMWRGEWVALERDA
ncbi:uncharacterized protein BDZ99DRAFT_514182 [Mytilinidion resinicola]|uniref:Uncharacterized protein n=1 Tax=Mytilinidion resinicola TaxID=574789 RepID=A0A6A6ZAB0_9PEZI|nr:uncharacterized protein BDZ99DRAFT_514182 [Mytilinidion resinicola]KAF2817960.1 hypothetical protein BDZ99DRAFT_514182 [Mytilinidion resinicola]